LKISKRHLAKTISWRTIGTLDTVLISYFVTGEISYGIKIGAFEIISKMLLYYFHERLWFRSKINNSNKRHILKTFSWRFIGTLDTFTISWIITGNLFAGVKIGLIETISKMILYFWHEKLWYRINFGLNRRNKRLNCL
jgi:uncharacterized membrane protein